MSPRPRPDERSGSEGTFRTRLGKDLSGGSGRCRGGGAGFIIKREEIKSFKKQLNVYQLLQCHLVAVWKRLTRSSVLVITARPGEAAVLPLRCRAADVQARCSVPRLTKRSSRSDDTSLCLSDWASTLCFVYRWALRGGGDRVKAAVEEVSSCRCLVTGAVTRIVRRRLGSRSVGTPPRSLVDFSREVSSCRCLATGRT